MNTRVEQVLQMALLDSSEFKLNEKILDIHEVIRTITDNIRLQAESRNGKLIVDLEAQRMHVMADESHMTNVLISILDNAIKYSPMNPEIKVSTFNSGPSIIISISDNGIGIARRHLNRIFDSFYQVDNSLARKAEGCGLGLSIVKFIVDSHKGTISVDSKPGKGSTFTVRIPLYAGSD